ncbi:MAG TPA: hypothetical protein VF932_10460 [Anaerolineae bacterium]
MRDRRRNRRGSRQFLTNLDAPYPLPTKIKLLVRNLSLRLLRLQTCCGHPGEPGC